MLQEIDFKSKSCTFIISRKLLLYLLLLVARILPRLHSQFNYLRLWMCNLQTVVLSEY